MTREERIKCKRKQELSLQRVGEHPLLSVTSQLGRAAAAGQGVRRKLSVLGTLPLPGDLLGWMPLGRMPEMGDTGCSAQAPADARACPGELDVSKQKTIQTAAGRVSIATHDSHPPSSNPTSPHPFSSWTKLTM